MENKMHTAIQIKDSLREIVQRDSEAALRAQLDFLRAQQCRFGMVPDWQVGICTIAIIRCELMRRNIYVAGE